MPPLLDARRAIAVGLLTGVFSGLTGVGGGAILVSLLVSVVGLSQHMAQGTSPAIILPTALFGAVSYAAQGLSGRFEFDLNLAGSIIPALAFPSLAGVVVGSTWMSGLPAAQLRRAFGVFLFLVAFSMLTRDLLPIGTPPGETVAVPFIFWILLGFVSGVFSGFLGIGGALVMLPFMTLGAGLPQHMSQGITLAVVAITTVAGVITQRRLGNVSTAAVKTMAPASLLAVVAASVLAGVLDAFWLTKIFGGAMAYFGYQFAFVTTRPNLPEPPSADPKAGFYHI